MVIEKRTDSDQQRYLCFLRLKVEDVFMIQKSVSALKIDCVGKKLIFHQNI